jgi:hypothetical protein
MPAGCGPRMGWGLPHLFRRGAFIHFEFIDSSGEVLGNVQCNCADLEPGQTQLSTASRTASTASTKR